MLKLAVDVSGLRLPLRRALPLVTEMGVGAIELDARGEIRPDIGRTAVRELRKLFEDHRLKVSAITYRTHRGYADEDELDRRVQGTKAALDFAYTLGAEVVVNHIGRVPPTDSAAYQLLQEVLSDLGRYSTRSGAMLAFETGSEKPETLAKALSSHFGQLGVDLNPGRLLLAGFSPQEAVAELAGAIVHVHLNDAKRGGMPGEGVPAPLGRGEVDIPALLGVLDEVGFRGYCTLPPPPSDDPLAEIQAAVQYLRRL